jgi:putative phosphoribosyl transferase
MGAIASGGAMVINREVLEALNIPREVVAERALREGAEVARRDALYRDNLPILEVARRTVLLIDDGLATGATMSAAVQALRQYEPERIVCGVPIAAPPARALLQEIADEVVCVLTPERFQAVGQWYEHFEQTGDREVIELLERHRQSTWSQDVERRRAS